MNFEAVMAGLAGAVLLLAGIGLLVLAWRRRKHARGALIVGGWALIALSMWPWAMFGGPDRGPAIAITVLGLIALAIIMRNGAAFRRARGSSSESEEPDPDARAAPPEHIPWLRRGWVFLLAGPVALAASIAFGLLAYFGGPGEEADRLALSGYLTPIIWGGFAAWAASDPKLLRKTLGIIGAGLAGGAAVILLNGA